MGKVDVECIHKSIEYMQSTPEGDKQLSEYLIGENLPRSKSNDSADRPDICHASCQMIPGKAGSCSKQESQQKSIDKPIW